MKREERRVKREGALNVEHRTLNFERRREKKMIRGRPYFTKASKGLRFATREDERGRIKK